VEAAYRVRAAGRVDESRAMFADTVGLLVRAGEVPVVGLGKERSGAVQGRATVGITISSGDASGSLFFDTATGEPFAFGAGIWLRAEGPTVDAPFFVTQSPTLYDPTTGHDADLHGTFIVVHPDGHRAYVLDEACRLQEWNVAEARPARALGVHRTSFPMEEVEEGCPGCPCDGQSFHGARISTDGGWLVSQWGRWRLTSGEFKPLPFRWSRGGYAPALSPDGRYVARVRVDPGTPRDAAPSRTQLVLYDLERGTSRVAPRALPFLSNGDPLTFGTAPLRVCVTDYDLYAFAVPSLAVLSARQASWETRLPDPIFTCSSSTTPAPEPSAEVMARLASHVCSLGGFLLPREQCEHAP
jgi:hypothetical protein